MQSVTVNLRRPVGVGEQPIRYLKVRPPTLTDIRRLGVHVEFPEAPIYFTEMRFNALLALMHRCIVSPLKASAWLGDIAIDDTWRIVTALDRLYNKSFTHRARAREFRG